MAEYVERVRAGLARGRAEGKRLGQPGPIAGELEKAIRAALDKPGRTEVVRKIAARFGGCGRAATSALVEASPRA